VLKKLIRARRMLGVSAALGLIWASLALPVSAQNYVPARSPESAQGAFLKGRVALLTGDIATAAEAYKEAWFRDPKNDELHEQAYLGALIIGDMSFLTQYPISDEVASTPVKVTKRLTAAVSALQRNDESEALKAVESLLSVREADRTGLLLRPWVLALNGKWDEALLTPPAAQNDRLVSLFLKLEQAQILEIKGRKEEAESLYKTLCTPGAGMVFFGPDYAAFLERAGRKAEAVTLYEGLMAQSNDPSLKLAYARAKTEGAEAPEIISLKQGAAQALFLAASVYGGEQETDFTLINLRQFLYLNAKSGRKPEDGDKTDRAQVLLGQVLLEMRDVAAAEAAWSKIAKTSPYYAEAQQRLAWSLKDRDDVKGAEAIFNELSARDPQNPELVLERAYLLRGREDNEGALKLMQAYLATPETKPLDWQGLYFMATLYDLNNDWPLAEATVKKAMTLKADEAEMLNFLGYGWIERGVNLKAGLEMVKKAQGLSPRSGAIMDSVGWGYYKLKDYQQARMWIEKAFQFEPANPEIYEHMGDVYLALNRVREAQFEWERVKTLDPSRKQLDRIQAKIDRLPDPLPVKASSKFVGAQASR
jgi:tetratricopeptide (TPR) repeat protein